MRTVILASVSVLLAGAACADRTPTGLRPDASSLTPTTAVSEVATTTPGAATGTAALAPRAGDRILVDARASIQQATGIWRAVDGIAPGASYTGAFTFTSNVDGAGTNAIRLDIQPRGRTACQMGTNAINVPLPSPRPTRMFVQWKQRQGRTATGGGEGRVGEFSLDNVCNGIVRTEARVFRDLRPTDSLRLEYELSTATAAPQVRRYKPNAVIPPADSSTYDPRQSIGRTVTKTMYLQAESRPGASDGIVRVWVDDRLVVERVNIALSTAAFRRFNFPGRVALPLRAMTEYFWDVRAWQPAVTPPPADTTTPPDTTETPDTTATQVATITLSPSSPSLLAGSTLQMIATVRNARGDTLRDKTVAWVSSAPAIATVDGSGLLRGVSAGSSTVTASAEGKSASTIVTVGNVPVGRVDVTPASDTMTVGGTRQLFAATYAADGRPLNGRPITWSSLNSARARVDSTGLVTALAAGSVQVTAVSEGVADTATLSITNPPPAPVASVSVTLNAPSIQVGQQTQASAVARDAQGNALEGRRIVWSSSNASVATVDSTGRVRGVAAGSADITATSEGRSGSAALTVTTPAPTPVATVAVSPATASIQRGGTTQLSATTRDANGNVLTGRQVAWTSSNGAVAMVSSAGVVTGMADGSATITATSEGQSGSAAITVTEPPPPPTGNIVDATLLPRASGQRAVAGSYGRSLAAGQTYVDPNSQVTVLKVTDPRTPAANSGMYHGYSEGGPNISLPWTGSDGGTYYTLWVAWNSGWFVDVKYPQLTLSNWRQAPVSAEAEGAWSMNPATPRIFYYAGSNTLNRYDTQGMRIANTAGFPFSIPSSNGTYLTWLQTQVNDTWIVGMLGSNATIVGYRPSDGTVRYITGAATGLDIDEPHIDREQPVVYISAGSSGPQNVIWNLNTNTRTNPRDTQGIVNDDHNAPMRGKIVGVSWQANASVSVDWQGNVTRLPGGSPTNWAGDYHMAGQWSFGNTSEYFAVDQWQSNGTYPVALGMIGLQSTNGDMRLLAAHDAVGGSYQNGGQPHITFAPDGKLLMWTSNMNGSGRMDIFVARMPTR